MSNIQANLKPDSVRFISRILNQLLDGITLPEEGIDNFEELRVVFGDAAYIASRVSGKSVPVSMGPVPWSLLGVMLNDYANALEDAVARTNASENIDTMLALNVAINELSDAVDDVRASLTAAKAQLESEPTGTVH